MILDGEQGSTLNIDHIFFTCDSIVDVLAPKREVRRQKYEPCQSFNIICTFSKESNQSESRSQGSSSCIKSRKKC
jgi:hypothetical protein